ncbi:adult cuticle protein 1-like [Uranotaenia lowii]|uniref:adult cuticle protein 1-like n=1 Tax=Uranotaenia lowii TaxID=190385 RepID=UPI002479DC7E|nr:adult cuticle protein 1-like [Uranotaenia lowii]XP_055593832.1 adult cuticle protein 1-like [Uranotaenia lowii]XP_055600380.1 adult cuticle protein 1-like [Uranotaenia lowii]XP_055600395.1 adult cuticle protein 1-like [Uranotaenia lowii]
MKFVIAAVVLALAVASEASWPYGPYGATVVQANAGAWPAAHWGGAWPAAAHWGGAAAWPAAHWAGAHWGGAWGPYAAGHWGAPAASVAHHAGVVPGAVSVNANRGSVHVAPLPGHAVSQKQLNLAPAPGTI